MIYKSANIKSKEEALERLDNGEVFCTRTLTDVVLEIKYDPSFVFKGESPYRCGSEALQNWSSYIVWAVKEAWHTNIPKYGVLCWVSDTECNPTSGNNACDIDIITAHYECSVYFEGLNRFFKYAEPLTKKEIQGYYTDV
jgi:hypothetical protein